MSAPGPRLGRAGLKEKESTLCESCSKVDLFALFTGPRRSTDTPTPTPSQSFADVGTLRDILENVGCPLCRLIKHDLFGRHGQGHRLQRGGHQPDLSRVRCYLRPYRADYSEDTTYLSETTRDQVATVVQVCLRGVDGCSPEELDLVSSCTSSKCGFQLLSPDSVDASRPLLNGYQATTFARSLELLADWIKVCKESHKETCGQSRWDQQPRLETIRLIDVSSRALVVKNPALLQYAALSYVWGKQTQEYLRLAAEVQCDGNGSLSLPATAPSIIEDALEVCRRLEIAFLWVDLYCVPQHDQLQKEQDIENMGLIYQNALVTLVAGFSGDESNNRLLPSEKNTDIQPLQLVEEIRGKKYITSLLPLFWQMAYSHWNDRGWTYQEGALARRIAFFGGLDVSFQCGAGHWRESLHSGPYGHDASLASECGLDVRSRSRYTLSTHDWLNTPDWNFSDYKAMLWTYSTRQLTYDSDKINAISGCLNMLGQRKGVRFIWGLPSVDLHYALLWNGAYDRPRLGFPSWSWAGWYARQNFYPFSPKAGTSGGLLDDGTGKLVRSRAPTAEISLLGGLSLKDMAKSTRCLQTVSDLEVQGDAITIRSEIAHFHFEVSDQPPTTRKGRRQTTPVEEDPETLTSTLYAYIRVTNTDGDECGFERQCFPKSLRASTMAWLQQDGFDLVKILELEHLSGEESTRHFHYVFCLGIDRSEAEPKRGRRFGWYIISAEDWARARPDKDIVTIF